MKPAISLDIASLRCFCQVVLLLACLMPFSLAAAETTSTIAPQEIALQALQHSYAIQSADQEILAASALRAQAKAHGLPSVDTRAQALFYDGLENEEIAPGSTIPVIEDRYSFSAEVTQPLYTGGRIDNQRKSAQSLENSAKSSRSGKEADVLLNALLGYWTWSRVYYSADALEASVAQMKVHAADMDNRCKAGLATDNDALSSQVLLDQTIYRLEEMRHRIDVARARLEFLIGHPLAAGISPLKAPEQSPLDPPSEESAIQEALKNRPELTSLKYDVEALRAQERAQKGNLYPQLSLGVKYEYARPNLQDFPPEDAWKSDVFAGMTLNWNVWDWGLTRSKVAEISSRAAQADIARRQNEEQIGLGVKEARITLLDAQSRLITARRLEESARRNLEAATSQWTNGLALNSDVLDALTHLTDARSQVVSTRADVVMADIALRHARGLLKKDSLSW